MSYSKHETINSDNDVIYFSNSKSSFPYKMYMNMQKEFWRQEYNISEKRSQNHNKLFNILPDKYNTSSIEISSGIDTNSDSSKTITMNNLKIDRPVSQNFFNTSENNEDTNQDFNSKITLRDTTSHAIPLSVDMSTQFNSDMKIIVEQDIHDKNIVNIKFGGTFTGSMTGSGTIPHDTLISLINESQKDRQLNESKIQEPPKIMKVKPLMPNSKIPSGSEESVSYFASTKPVEPLVTKTNSQLNEKASENIRKTPDGLTANLKSDATINSVSKLGLNTQTLTQYDEPFTEGQTFVSMLPSMSYYSTNKSLPTTPAVLPTCIIRRIVRAMVTDLQLPKARVRTPYKSELKVKTLTNLPEILNLNWHAAIKRGKVMIGELIELILSVNIDNSNKSLNEVNQVLFELKNEFIGCCVYLAKLTENSKIKEKICLELIIDQMTEEIDRLLALYSEWKKTNMKTDFSVYFIKDFTNTLSPDVSEINSTTRTSTSSTTNEQTSVSSQTPKINKNKSQEQILNKKPSQTSSKLTSDLSEKHTVNDKKIIDTPLMFVDPSIITNSRIKKTMNTISQLAIEQNLGQTMISKESRKQIMPLEIVDDHPILKRNLDISIIKELNDQTQLWQKPINAGKISIQDLIEFIVNTLVQDKESSKELYAEIVKELGQLESELLVSVAKNLHDSRVSDDDLKSLCYEILAEIIYDEMAIAKYMFNSLDLSGIDNMMLGKLFRNYTNDNPGIREKFRPVTADNYAHLTSEIMNYSDGTRNKIGIGSDNISSSQRKSPSSKQNSISEDYKSNIENPMKFIGKQNRSNQDDVSYSGGSNQLLLIINKLNNQTNEINKIKETLEILSGCVEEKLSNWTCNYINSKLEKSQAEIPEKKNIFNYSKENNLYNIQEVVEPPVDLLKNIQPSEHVSFSETNLNAIKVANKSYIAPISSQTIEQKVKTPQAIKKTNSSEPVDFDLLKLIGDGAHNFLISKQLKNNNTPQQFQRRDSCKSFNTEFDKIFEWICEKYEENLGLMMKNSASKTIVDALKNAPLEERRKIERELINRIIEQHNFSINNWVRDICFQKVLDCLA